MILYYSGRCCGEYDNLPSRPEDLLREAYIMMSYRYAQKDDLKRFLKIVDRRKKGRRKCESIEKNF